MQSGLGSVLLLSFAYSFTRLLFALQQVPEPRVLDSFLFEYEQLGYIVQERDTGYEYVADLLIVCLSCAPSPHISFIDRACASGHEIA